jgi:hypothetical protein
LVLRAAQKLNGSEISVPTAVAMTAIWSVSISGATVRGKKLQSGTSNCSTLPAPFCQLRAIAEKSTSMPMPGRHMTTVMATITRAMTGAFHAPFGFSGSSSGVVTFERAVVATLTRADPPG